MSLLVNCAYYFHRHLNPSPGPSTLFSLLLLTINETLHQLITISFHIAVSGICNRHIKIICHAGVKWIVFQKSKMPDTVCTIFTVCKLCMYYVIISIFPFGCKRA